MPLSLDEAYSIIEQNITGKLRHPNYKRVTELATLYKQLITGNNIDSLLRQFTRREDNDLFEQRKKITQIITPAVAAAIRSPFYKVGRVNNIIRKIKFKDAKEDDVKLKKIEDALRNYYGESSLDSYLKTRFVDLSFTDPNAFIVTEFDPVPIGANGEMEALPQPRPCEISSKNAVNFEYNNNILQWLLVELPSNYLKEGKSVAGYSYTLYFSEYALKYTQVDVEQYKTIAIGSTAQFVNQNGDYEVFRADETRAFLVNEFEHKSKLIPAKRIGYKEDLDTNGENFVNPFHDALCYFMKSIKTVSEFDLTMCLQAFPKLFQYVNRCQGKGDHGCSKGITTEGTTCAACNGSGLAIHKSAQDAVVLPLPRDKEEMFDLSQMIHTESLDIALPDFQNKYIQQLKNEVFNTVFNADQIQTPSGTATEAILTADNKNNTVYPFSEKLADVYKYIATVSCYYLDITDAEIIYSFPKDFKFKTVDDLLAQLKLSNDSNAPGYVRRELSNDIAEQQFIDKPEELQRIRAKERFYPFPDKTDTEIIYIISNGKTTLFNEVLWANFDMIFGELEDESANNGNKFYELAFKEQKRLLSEKVQAIITQIQSEQTQPAITMPVN